MTEYKEVNGTICIDIFLLVSIFNVGLQETGWDGVVAGPILATSQRDL